MSETITTLANDIVRLENNPALIQERMLDHLSALLKGEIDIVNPTSPFVFALESSTVLAGVAMAKSEASTRKMYPLVANADEDLYRHMADVDYIGRFALPSKAVITIAMDNNEVISRLIDSPEEGIRKLIIPRNTLITVAGIVFSLQYPIVIKQLVHGGIQVVYDNTEISPLESLETNIVNFEIVPDKDREWLLLHLDLAQFSINSNVFPVTLGTVFKHVLPISTGQQFYHVRAYVETQENVWKEIDTTHSDQIYRNDKITAVIKVLNGALEVMIPQVYINKRMVTSRIRLDIYETRGALNLDLGAYPTESYEVKWNAINKAKDFNEFSAPLRNLRTLSAFSNNVSSGGSNGLTFEELRTRVINNATGKRELPITPTQAVYSLKNSGYDVVTNVDTVTQRVMLATRQLPPPISNKLITASASSIRTVMKSMAALAEMKTVFSNDLSLTITPDTLYQINSGILTVVNQAIVDEILAQAPDKRALSVTNGEFFYSPFYYVLDSSRNEFEVRPYHLDEPKVLNKVFVSNNSRTMYDIGIDAYMLEKKGKDYVLTISTRSDDNTKDIPDSSLFCQLAYVPFGEKDRVYLNGVLFGKDPDTNERVYKFYIESNLNVDRDDNLELTSFKVYDDEQRVTGCPLVTSFDVIFSTSASVPATWQSGDIDKVLGRAYLPSKVYGVNHEKLSISFGSALKSLWARAKSVASTQEYMRHENDTPAIYENDILAKDPLTGSAIDIVDGQLTYRMLHKAGDPVLDTAGQPFMKYKKGELVLDSNGKPIVVNERNVIRQFDIMLLEGAYWFATDAVATSYRSEMTKTFISWIMNDLVEISKNLLEKTRIYFYPKSTLGDIEVLVGEGRVLRINSSQSLQLNITVTDSVYNNLPLRKKIEDLSTNVINNALKERTIDLSTIITSLRLNYGDDVIGVVMSGLGGKEDLSTFTITDDGERASLRKRLVAQGDNTLIVEEDVTYNFIRHSLK